MAPQIFNAPPAIATASARPVLVFVGPHALPLFASGLVGLGLLGRRRKRKPEVTNRTMSLGFFCAVASLVRELFQYIRVLPPWIRPH